MGHLALSQWQTDSRSGRSCQFWCLICSQSLHGEQSGPAGRSRLASPAEEQHKQGLTSGVSLWGCVHAQNRYLNIFTEVADGLCSCILQVIVDPAEQQLLRRERHQTVQTLPVCQKAYKAWTHVKLLGLSGNSSTYHIINGILCCSVFLKIKPKKFLNFSLFLLPTSCQSQLPSWDPLL